MRAFSFIPVTLYCLAIAAIDWVFKDFDHFRFFEVLLVSLAFGWSVYFSFLLCNARLSRWLGPWLAFAALITFGLVLGAVIGGLIIAGDPLLFFIHDYSTIMLGLLLAVVGFGIFGSGELTRSSVDRIVKRVLRQVKGLLAQADIESSQKEIKPDFLSNTLSSVNKLIGSEQATTEKALEELTILLQGLQARDDVETITLGQEFDFAKAFLGIHATGLEGRLRYSCDLPADLRASSLPPLLTYPLLENAVIHGIEPRAEGGEVKLVARREADAMVLSVSDNGVGIKDGSTLDGPGLRNVRERLRLVHGGNASLELTPSSTGGITAQIKLPL